MTRLSRREWWARVAGILGMAVGAKALPLPKAHPVQVKGWSGRDIVWCGSRLITNPSWRQDRIDFIHFADWATIESPGTGAVIYNLEVPKPEGAYE